jgi:hypothetical protein
MNDTLTKARSMGQTHKWLTLIWACFIWTTFACIVLTVAIASMCTFRSEVWLCGAVCLGVSIWGLKNDPWHKLYPRVGYGVLGAILGAIAAMILDYFAFPADFHYGIELVSLQATTSAIGGCLGICIKRKMSGLPFPSMREIPDQLVFVVGAGLIGSMIAAVLCIVVGITIGIPDVGIGLMELHFRFKTNVPALQEWLVTLPADVPPIPKESWPGVIQELKPTDVEKQHGRLRIRFRYNRAQDYTVIIRPSNQCKYLYEAVEIGRVEH